MASPDACELFEIPLPDGVGAEMIGGVAHLVASRSDLSALMRAIWDQIIDRAATVVLASTAPQPVVRLTSPAERGDGQCTLPGCTETGAQGHVHPFWQTARANGRLTPSVAQRWTVAQWTAFLRAHHITQAEALDRLRSWCAAAGEPAPSGLRAIDGRFDLAGVLLEMADGMLAFAQAAGDRF